MELKIIQEKENLLFKRKEIQGSVESEVTPSRANIKELISKKFSTSDDSIKIKKILGKFGSKTFIIGANVYSSKEDKERIEPESKKEKVEKKEKTQEEKIEEKSAESQGDAENKELEKPIEGETK